MPPPPQHRHRRRLHIPLHLLSATANSPRSELLLCTRPTRSPTSRPMLTRPAGGAPAASTTWSSAMPMTRMKTTTARCRCELMAAATPSPPAMRIRRPCLSTRGSGLVAGGNTPHAWLSTPTYPSLSRTPPRPPSLVLHLPIQLPPSHVLHRAATSVAVAALIPPPRRHLPAPSPSELRRGVDPPRFPLCFPPPPRPSSFPEVPVSVAAAGQTAPDLLLCFPMRKMVIFI
jgi:hypothetical protein